jgi:hypothetical protein
MALATCGIPQVTLVTPQTFIPYFPHNAAIVRALCSILSRSMVMYGPYWMVSSPDWIQRCADLFGPRPSRASESERLSYCINKADTVQQQCRGFLRIALA